MIEFKNVSASYDGELAVLADVSFTVNDGDFVAFVGTNGAGKSTTLKMILGLVRPTAGDIRVLGKKMDGGNRLAVLRQVGSLIESPSYYGHLTGEENLRIVQTLRGVPEKNIREVLQIVRLDGQRGKRVAHYSLGMKQRLGLAAALLGYPKLLILDEPVTGLDPAAAQDLYRTLAYLNKNEGLAIVMVTHDLQSALQYADTVLYAGQGKWFHGTTAEYLASPYGRRFGGERT